MEWFEETLHEHWRQRIAVKAVIACKHTGLQDALVFDSFDFGRVLVLDGAVQTTTGDEFVYHEMLVQVPLMAHPEATRVLIIGGGDGGSLREALRHERVARAVLVDLDGGVVALSKQHLPSLSAGAFDDPRAEVIIGDGAAFVQGAEERFDVIIVDSTDPVGPGEILFSPTFYADCRRCLADGGVIATQSGNPMIDRRSLDLSGAGLAQSFANVAFYRAALPTYVGGDMTFGFATDDPTRFATPRAQPPHGLRYYSTAVHAAAFALPPWLA